MKNLLLIRDLRLTGHLNASAQEYSGCLHAYYLVSGRGHPPKRQTTPKRKLQ